MGKATYYLAGTRNGFLKVWQSGGPGRRTRTKPVLTENVKAHTKDINDIKAGFGTFLVTVSDDSTVKSWEIFNLRNVLKGHKSWVNSVDFSSNGKYVISASNDKTIKLWNVNTGKCIRTYRGHSKRVNCVRFFDNDNKIVSSGHDGTIRIWKR